jgi:signal transduction histidine kinase
MLGAMVLATRSDQVERSLVSLVEDLAHRVASSVDAARLYRSAQEAIASRDTLLAVVSHDLKNPLSSVVMGAELLLAQVPAVERRRRGRKQLEVIQRSAAQMKRLVEDLLDVANIEANHFSLHCQRQAIEPILREAIEQLAPLAKAKAVDLEATSIEGPLEVNVDRSRILQVLSNLIGNAIKFTPERGRIELSIEASHAEVEVSVTDSGPGIPAERQPEVFRKFWQADETSHLGSGLGLFIAKGIVEAHGGRIEVSSPATKGTRFAFTLPRALG